MNFKLGPLWHYVSTDDISSASSEDTSPASASVSTEGASSALLLQQKPPAEDTPSVEPEDMSSDQMERGRTSHRTRHASCFDNVRFLHVRTFPSIRLTNCCTLTACWLTWRNLVNLEYLVISYDTYTMVYPVRCAHNPPPCHFFVCFDLLFCLQLHVFNMFFLRHVVKKC